MNRAGSARTPSTRAIVTAPASIGPRSASSASARNWRVSSRKSAPRWARLASPGRILGPPPTSACVEMVWCGARNGRRRLMAARGSRSPATEWMRLTSAASRSSSSGSSPAAALASSVLPTPGGPVKARLCLPATAISSMRRATTWPMIEPEVRGVVQRRLGLAGRRTGDLELLQSREMAGDLPEVERRRAPGCRVPRRLRARSRRAR